MYGIDSEQMFSNASSRFDAMFGSGDEEQGNWYTFKIFKDSNPNINFLVETFGVDEDDAWEKTYDEWYYDGFDAELVG